MQHASQREVQQAAERGRDILEGKTTLLEFKAFHEGLSLRLYESPCGVIRVQDTRSGVAILIKCSPHHGLQFTTEGTVVAAEENGKTVCRVR